MAAREGCPAILAEANDLYDLVMVLDTHTWNRIIHTGTDVLGWLGLRGLEGYTLHCEGMRRLSTQVQYAED
jgi:hypothetical protein